MYGAESLDPTQLLKDAKLKSMTRCTNVAEAYQVMDYITRQIVR